jgi:P27 family predicted phage terminase small subunit
MRGRKPAPTKLKILKGVQNDRINHSEPVPPSGKPETPKHLGNVALEEWERICVVLQQMNLLSRADGLALELYCECRSKWLWARAEVKEHGMLIKSTTDVIRKNKVVATKEYWRANPAINIEIQMCRLMKDFLIEFGLTPSSRSRIPSTAPRPKDELEEFLERNA